MNPAALLSLIAQEHEHAITAEAKLQEVEQHRDRLVEQLERTQAELDALKGGET